MPVQLSILGSTVALGAGMGTLYDIFRTWRLLARPRRWQLYLADFIYWFLAALGVFVGLLLTNWAEVRFFMLLGLALGAGLYLRWLSPWVLPVFKGGARFIIKLVNIVTWPLRGLGFLVHTLQKNFLPSQPQKEGITEMVDE